MSKLGKGWKQQMAELKLQQERNQEIIHTKLGNDSVVKQIKERIAKIKEDIKK